MYVWTMRNLLIFFFALSLFSSCNQEDSSISRWQNIYQIQQKGKQSIDSITLDTLRYTQKLLDQDSTTPDSLLAENNYLQGLFYKKEGKLDSAAIYFHNATDYVKDSIFQERQPNYFYDAWLTYASLGKSGDCFVISERFKSLLNHEKQQRALLWAYHWEERTYKMRREYNKAIEINDQRRKIAYENDSASIPVVSISRANLYFHNLNKKNEAYKILDELLLNPKVVSDRDLAAIHTNYGVYKYLDGNFESAVPYYLAAIKYTKKDTLNKSNTNELANAYSNIAEVYIDLEQFEKSRTYLDSVQLLGINNLARDKQKNLLSYELRLAMKTNRNSNQVLNVFNTMYNHQDEIYKEKSKNEILALTKANEKEKVLLKEKQEVEIKNIRNRDGLILALISLVLLGAIGFLLYQRRKLKYEKASLQGQQRLLRSQMNPHFTFNTLAAIQSNMEKNPKEASNYLMKFSRLLRLILENSMQNYVQLEKELESLRKYLDLQLLRFPNTFTYSIELNGLEEDEFIFIPPMLMQPFVENSIEHGFKGIDYIGHLKLNLELKGEYLAFELIDNGIGLREHSNKAKNSASVKLISDFIKKVTKSDLKLENREERDLTGTRVQFSIPFKYTEND